MKRIIKQISIIAIYVLIMYLLKITLQKIGVLEYLYSYILFDNSDYNFKELLSIGITVLAIFIGAIITAVTVLISMCNKRLMNLIKNFNKAKFLVSKCKLAILSGIIATCLYAIIYAQLDFNILKLRIVILLIANYLLLLFISNSILIVNLVLKLLKSTLEDDDKIIAKSSFVNPNNENDN